MSVYRLISECLSRGDAAVLCTIVASRGSTPRRVGSKMLVFADGRIEGSVGGGEMESRVVAAALDALADGESRLVQYNLTDPGRGDPGVCGGTLEIFVEPIQPEPTIVVAGGGHVGKAVVHLAKWLGFRVVLTDDRPEFCTPEAVPGADEYFSGPLSRLPEQMAVTPFTFLVLTTRNVMIDVEGMPALFKTPASFIGVIGSRRRWATTREKLAALGVSEEQLARVISPMGLELNAETPEEIAVSIMAEVVMVMRGGDGGRMGV